MGDSWIAQNLRAIIANLTDECSGSGISLDAAEGYKWRIELMYRDFLAKECLNGELHSSERIVLGYLSEAHKEMCQYVDGLVMRREDSVVPAGTGTSHSFSWKTRFWNFLSPVTISH